MPIPLIIGGALLGGSALGIGGARVLKDELNMGVDAAAREELNQGKGRGYNSEGNIQRGLFEQLRDYTMGNDPTAIQERAREMRVDDINETLGKKIKATNAGLVEVGGDGSLSEDVRIKPTYTDTIKGIRDDIDVLTPKIERTAQGQADAPDAGITLNTPAGQIAVKSRSGIRSEENLAYLESPAYQNMIKQQNLTNQLALGQMGLAEQRASNQMEIAMMNNRLDRRRMDMQEARADRKDRQAMIQQMMQGLSTLGASIAI